VKGYSGGLSRVWQTETTLGGRTHSVWSPDRASADAALDSAMAAAKDLVARGADTARVTQVMYYLSRAHRRGPGAICTLMNGTMPRIVMMHAEWQDGALAKYLYRRTHTQDELSEARLPDVLAHDPPAYREAYTDLLHSRLFGLCLRSKTFVQWSRTVQQSGADWPVYIAKYLWRQVHGESKGKKAGGVRGAAAGSDAGDEARPCER